ncbi:glycosyltransferase family 4 protein [Flavobacterium sp. TSSA_36]|uniref:glycosyltransferase family 4 protein n=1 Tax=Flavobacterium sp. TSSA_36 TaxID=3447669 RepID=UPI003F323C78
MILGIDATNIRAGGGLTHLKEILVNANPSIYDFTKVVIWSSNDTLIHLPNLVWLDKVSHPYLNKSFLWSFFYQKFFLSKSAQQKYNCDVLFVPGGTFFGSFLNVVSMSQNMLPFEKEERNRFPSWKTQFKFKILKYSQSTTFKKSQGIIFLTNYAKEYITNEINLKNNSKVIIPHGINLSFLNDPKKQQDIADYTFDNPFKLLYVSIVTVYKHQWNVVAAVLKIREEGFPITLDLVGTYTEESLKKLKQILSNDIYNCINYRGLIPYEELDEIYKDADSFVFASSCENMPIILIEAMTAGLPIASSNYGPMPEVLGDAGFYFDPLKTEEIYLSIKEMLISKEKREKYAWESFNKSINYTWKECSDKTFEYLSLVAKKYSNENTK